MHSRNGISLAGLLLIASSACAETSLNVTGTVFDAATKKPVEGAFVVATYHRRVLGPGVDTSVCIKTRGMYTGKDGKYSFPVEKTDGYSPAWTSAIKPGYYRGPSNRPPRGVYEGYDLSLQPQVDGAPKFLYGATMDVHCTEAPTREAAAAGAEFLRIQLAERKRLSAPQGSTAALERMLTTLEALPSSPAK